ncbi:hypothetical protein BDV26DRAFT_175817 [Aspergillus bertholletiae]|uniref:Polyketide synthase n=1 Tax=Aspergillus bertholletiae TaxID=1226010 RepID=A0A5N7BBL9_9EURO|nr:hypothetical protein BDV26DRAFT_175817 [Aspergillus bertholletiae]
MQKRPCEEYPEIAIVGMAMRLPGGVRTDTDFWNLMVNKQDGRCKVPETRYNVDAFYSDKGPHTVKTDQGYFLQDDPACFDTGFFSIGEYEASRLDPQQRLLLEVVWECMENAGQNDWRSKDIGCYVGVFGEDWLDLSSKDVQQIGRLHALGTGNFALSNRISYEYDLTGPSITYQTGCSSSLVGLHEACRALHAGDCSSAIVAGSNLIFTPTMTTTMSDNMVIAHDGKCKTFDASANGYGRGEGINAIYIKPLQAALQDGDRIRAVIRSTSTNCDGKTPSITTPGSLTQKELIRKTYQNAGIGQITDTPFFELHGTGTKVGDVAETSVIAELFSGEQGTYIGTVKPNVGHSEGASGLTSVIKAVLALENRIIPPNIHFHNPNPEIPFGDGKLEVPVEPVAWPKGRKERISVNCFGIGGANAHAILDSAQLYRTPPDRTLCQSKHSKGVNLLLVSAASLAALDQRVKKLKKYIENHSPDMNNVAYTLANRLTLLPYRTFLYTDMNKPIQLPEYAPSRASPRELIFLFTGQGAQWPGMARELMTSHEGFRNDIRKMDETLRDLQDPPEWSIEEVLVGAECTHEISDAALSQPICTAVQIGIINLLARLGITPCLVVGHSSGEIAAAYAAKAISQEAALLAAYYRGHATKSCGKGAMAAVALERETLSSYLAGDVVIACENGPKSFTISGEEHAVSRAIGRISEDHPDVFCRRLPVDIAYHSHYMRDIGEVFETMIRPHMRFNETMVPFYSTVQRSLITRPGQLSAQYWRENLESPVLFSSTVDLILKDENYPRPIFLEIGPHSALSGPIRQIKQNASNDKASYIPTLLRDRCGNHCILASIGQLWAHGVTMDLEKVTGAGSFVTDLPAYPWEHGQRFWNESSLARSWRLRAFPNHELLGCRLLGSSDLEPTWRSIVSLEDVPWLADHKIMKDIVFPGAGYVAMVGEAIRQLTGAVDYTIKGLILRAPIFLVEMESVEILTSLKPTRLTDIADSEWYDFTIMSYDGVSWVRNCQGQACAGPSGEPQKNVVIHPFTRKVPSDRWYNFMAKHGLRYGPSFQGLGEITADPTSCNATGTAAEYQNQHDSHYSIHPIIIDQALQLLAVAICSGRRRGVDRIGVPARFKELYIGKAHGPIQFQAESHAISTIALCGNAIGISNDNNVVLSVHDGTFMSLEAPLESNVPITSHIEWKPDINFHNKQELLPFNPRGVCGEFMMLHTMVCIIETVARVEGLPAVSAHLEKYRDWLKKVIHDVASRGDYIATKTQEWVALNSKARIEAFEHLARRVGPDENDQLNLVNLQRQVIDNIVEIFKGIRSPVESLMEHNLLGKLYSTRVFQNAWNTFFSSLIHSNPRLRILEIGAGTGGSTEIALECLRFSDGSKAYSSYTFTDVSSGFFSSAREKFENCPDLEYKTLDINTDPIEQGFEEESFDLVIAVDVLHATNFIGKSLQHIRKLLVPGGYFLLQELCPGTPAIDCVMGMLPGWWVGSDDGRVEKPYITGEEWHKELQCAGFTGTEAETFDDVQPSHVNVNILTKNPYPNSLADKSVTLVCLSKPGDWALELSKSLLQKEYVVHWADIQGTASTHGIIVLVDLESPFLNKMTEHDYNNLQHFLSACANKQVLWIMPSAQTGSQDPNYGLVPGFVRSIRREMCPELPTLELDTFDTSSADISVRVYEHFANLYTNHAKRDYEYVLRHGVIYVGRYHWRSIASRYPQSGSGLNRKLTMKTPGLLDTVQWVSIDDKNPLHETDVEIDVKYCGLNFMDLMVSMGIVGTTEDFGLECSGIVRRVGSKVRDVAPGDRVVVASLGVLRTRIVVAQDLCIKIPEALSLEDSATMPTVYATATYSLVTQGNLKRGQSVLIHSACGGVGLAAIQICQVIGAKVFATVGSEEKTRYLEETFGIPREQIFNSHSAMFLPAVMKATDNRGVDLVLNSLAGDLLHASWECVAKCGKMIELGKRDFIGHGTLGMNNFLGNRTFCGVDLITLGQECPEILKDLLTHWVGWLEEEKIRPIRPVTVFQAADVVDAFRYMQSGTHMGKIIIKMPDNGTELPISNPTPRFSLRSDGAYLLVGGLGGLGQAISNWMVEHGARHLIYLSRTAGLLEKHTEFIRQLEAQGCHVTMIPGDVTNISDVQRALDGTSVSVRGLIQMSMVLNDKSFTNMTFDEWTATVDPKVTGTWNLHNASRKQPLDFFVVLSSITGLCGNQGQANYAAANTFLDSFVQYRQDMGLPASVLDLGFVEDIGCVSQAPEILQRMHSCSVYALQEQELMDALQLAIQNPRACTSVNNDPSSSTLAIGLGCTRPLDAAGVVPPWNRDDIRFCSYENINIEAASDESDMSTNLREFLRDVEMNPAILDDPQTESRITGELGKMIISHTGRDREMDEEHMAAIAIDSLMSLEIRSWFRRKLSLELALSDISKAGTVGGLSKMTIELLRKKYTAQEGQVV